ncbi:hypothetical protein [Saccharopolyspora flava]|uniref:PH domain-containing protein n=1 Tax=Saccharopolyspora flava TaxID=95161 RepID=A0A1I6QTD4_9PSEU|nr:hypothetical protein [Saccharopolyspora flava]SFS55679.1 hypothetical protein SAMN05660874_01841 [Saccharopolyspora flava]
MDTALPPKPDISGEPRPPRAPELYVWGGVEPSPKLINSDWGRRAIPAPPDEQGPALEWWRASPTRLLATAGWYFAFGVVVLTIKNWGLSWMNSGSLWLALLVIPAAAVLFMNNDRPIAAGAHWLYHKRRWIRTYELESVRIAGGLTANDLALGQDGKELLIRVDNLQENPALWDLVYNGIRHSVANGAAVLDDPGAKQTTRNMLRL